jgi:GNAT superfamily N-acetyltransferase
MMSVIYRQLTTDDAPAYQQLVYQAYAPIRELGIRFVAAEVDVDIARAHLAQHAVYAMEQDGQLLATVTIRFPWGPEPGPYGLPHLGWFATHPSQAKKGLAKQLFQWLEHNVLIAQLRAPAVSLGTAKEHPWLVSMYRSLGFIEAGQKALGRGHLTIYMRKTLGEAATQTLENNR